MLKQPFKLKLVTLYIVCHIEIYDFLIGYSKKGFFFSLKIHTKNFVIHHSSDYLPPNMIGIQKHQYNSNFSNNDKYHLNFKIQKNCKAI